MMRSEVNTAAPQLSSDSVGGGTGSGFVLWNNSQSVCIYVYMRMCLHVDHVYMWMCTSNHSGWEKKNSSAPGPSPMPPSFLLHTPLSHPPPPPSPPGPARGLAGGHPTGPILSLSLCVSLPVPYSSATSAFGLFGQESPPPAAYNNKPTLVTISECVWLQKCVCVYMSGHKKKYL